MWFRFSMKFGAYKGHTKLQTQFILARSDEFDTNAFPNMEMNKLRIALMTCYINIVLYEKGATNFVSCLFELNL